MLQSYYGYSPAGKPRVTLLRSTAFWLSTLSKQVGFSPVSRSPCSRRRLWEGTRRQRAHLAGRGRAGRHGERSRRTAGCARAEGTRGADGVMSPSLPPTPQRRGCRSLLSHCTASPPAAVRSPQPRTGSSAPAPASPRWPRALPPPAPPAGPGAAPRPGPEHAQCRPDLLFPCRSRLQRRWSGGQCCGTARRGTARHGAARRGYGAAQHGAALRQRRAPPAPAPAWCCAGLAEGHGGGGGRCRRAATAAACERSRRPAGEQGRRGARAAVPPAGGRAGGGPGEALPAAAAATGLAAPPAPAATTGDLRPVPLCRGGSGAPRTLGAEPPRWALERARCPAGGGPGGAQRAKARRRWPGARRAWQAQHCASPAAVVSRRFTGSPPWGAVA